jgi:hypothetical protein
MIVAESNLIARLRSWISAGAAPRQLEAADLHRDFSYDDGIFRIPPPLAAEHARMDAAAGLEETSLLVEIVASESYVAVARGRDPVTNLWHQCCWVWTFEEGRVHRLVQTTARVPEQPYDGSVPLKSAPP